MLEKQPSGAPADLTPVPQPAGAAPGGPFPHGQPPADNAGHPSDPSHQYTLQYLIAAIKKSRVSSETTNPEKLQ
jgi:hypothetical protein